MKILRLAILLLVAFAVVAHGAVEDWARAVLETGAGLLFLFWALRCYRASEEHLVISPLLPPLAVFSLFVLGQWMFRATASSYSTRMELQLLAADVVLLFLAAQAFRTLSDWRALVWFLMICGFAVAIFGILQHLTFNGKLYWFREMRYGGIPFGPYANRNHFAGFAELIIPLSLVPLALGKVRRGRWVLVGLFALLPTGALFLSASRGGIVSFGLELLVLVVFLIFRGADRRHALAGGSVLLLAILLVYWLGARQILARFSSLQTMEVSQAKRASMRRDTLRIFLDHPFIGTGLGTLQIVFPPYESQYDTKTVNHTHNDYIEALAETGLAGGLLCAWFLAILFRESYTRIKRAQQSMEIALRAAGLIACVGFLVHSFVDFNLHIPANALLFFLMAQLAVGEIPQVPANSIRYRNRRNP